MGREHEVGLLRERWAQVQAGRGQIIVLSGEAGIGKSRLVQVLNDEFSGATAPRIEYRCSPYHLNSALYPTLSCWSGHWPCARTIRRRQAEEAGAGSRRIASPDGGGAAVCRPAVVPLPETYPPLTLSPQRQKQKPSKPCCLALAVTEQQPVLLVVEDLHWVDPSTLEFLSLLVDQVPTARLLDC